MVCVCCAVCVCVFGCVFVGGGMEGAEGRRGAAERALELFEVTLSHRSACFLIGLGVSARALLEKTAGGVRGLEFVVGWVGTRGGGDHQKAGLSREKDGRERSPRPSKTRSLLSAQPADPSPSLPGGVSRSR